jgi:hypothetical protein
MNQAGRVYDNKLRKLFCTAAEDHKFYGHLLELPSTARASQPDDLRRLQLSLADAPN